MAFFALETTSRARVWMRSADISHLATLKHHTSSSSFMAFLAKGAYLPSWRVRPRSDRGSTALSLQPAVDLNGTLLSSTRPTDVHSYKIQWCSLRQDTVIPPPAPPPHHTHTHTPTPLSHILKKFFFNIDAHYRCLTLTSFENKTTPTEQSSRGTVRIKKLKKRGERGRGH